MIKVGSIFDNRYLILQELGEGGMGKVYKAKQLDVERDVALKFLKEIHDEESKQRFFREFKVLSELNHKHIMTVYGMALYADVIPYAICELLEGKSLRQLLQEQGHLSWERAVDIAIQIASALEYAHKSGIIHRDLKPENIILVDKPHANYAKLIDFGLSKLLHNTDEKLTATGELLGSPMYMSPEQINQSADHRSDIYALGCIIFEMLSGEYLFPSDASVAAIYKHTTERATERISAVKETIPVSLIRLILDMLAKDPNSRMQSASEVGKHLIQIKESPGSMMDPTKKVDNKKAVPTKAIALSVFVLILIIVVFQNSIKASLRSSKDELNPVTTRSLWRRISDLDLEVALRHSEIVEFGSINGGIPLPPKTIKVEMELLKRLKALEPDAKTVQDRFDIYFLESKCYADMNLADKRTARLEKCLELARVDKRKNYEEIPGLLSLIASQYAHDPNHIEKALHYCMDAERIQKKQC